MRILLILVCMMSFLAQSQAQKKPSAVRHTAKTKVVTSGGGIPSGLKFNDSFHDFGTIKQGDVVNHDFEFVNMSKTPFVVSNATATCGCTTPSYPFVPINPGERGTIGIRFDSKNKLGNQTPTVTVTSNRGTFKLVMKGIVAD